MKRTRIPFIESDLPDAKLLSEDFQRIFSTARISNKGPFERRLCHRLADRIGVPACVTTANATLGLMLSIRELAIPGRRYALLPSFTFPATALAAQWCGLEPLFCDISKETWQPTLGASEAGTGPGSLAWLHEATRALSPFADEIGVLIPCNTFGAPCDIVAWQALGKALELPIVVDAAAGFGGSYLDGKPIGGSGSVEVFSMHATKAFGVAEGGVITTPDLELAKKLEAAANFGMDDQGECRTLGLNAKLSEPHAAIAGRVLDRFDATLQQRRELTDVYYENLLPHGFEFQAHVSRSPLQAIAVRVPPHCSRDQIAASLTANGIETRAYFSPPLHQHAAFINCQNVDGLKESESLAKSVLCLPMGTRLQTADILRVCEETIRASEASGD